MIQLQIEGFTVNTDMDEATPYCRMYESDDLTSFEGEIYTPVMDIIEQVIIGGQKISDFYYENRKVIEIAV